MTNTEFIIAGSAALAVIAVVAFMLIRKHRPVKLKNEHYVAKWKELQKLLRNKSSWAEAILEADSLLDEALKKKHIKGRSMGERLVKAQRLFTDNDSLWFGHKLRTKIDADPKTKLKEADVKQALMGIRQALKDVGALPQ